MCIDNNGRIHPFGSIISTSYPYRLYCLSYRAYILSQTGPHHFEVWYHCPWLRQPSSCPPHQGNNALKRRFLMKRIAASTLTLLLTTASLESLVDASCSAIFNSSNSYKLRSIFVCTHSEQGSMHSPPAVGAKKELCSHCDPIRG